MHWESLEQLFRRWTPLLAVGNLTFRTFHKSSQFPLMIRRHAQLVADDVLYDASFRQHCNISQDGALGRWGSFKLCAALDSQAIWEPSGVDQNATMRVVLCSWCWS